MEKKRFLSPNGINPKKLNYQQTQIQLTEEQKKIKCSDIFIKYEQNTQTCNYDANINSDESINYDIEENNMIQLENQINYTYDCLISPFENKIDYDINDTTEESSSEEEFDELEEEYLNYLNDK